VSVSPESKVRDIIVPVFLARRNESTFEYKTSCGTAFLIGKRGFAVTAAHVSNQINAEGDEGVLGFINDANAWCARRIVQKEEHPEEDVCILQLESAPPKPSWLILSNKSMFQSCKYDAWGYPIAIAEWSKKYEEHQLESPDLIYTHGYVRRKISKPLPFSIFRGSSFYELSEICGSGCSGGPVIDAKSMGKGAWDVFGIYLGTATTGEFDASYAVRSDAIFDWCPAIVGRSLREESLQR